VTLPAVALAVSAVLSGCGAGHGSGSADQVQVKQHDFKISAPSELSAGNVDLRVDNTGPDDHELIVVRAAGRLPLRKDGITVDEDAIEPRKVGSLEPGVGNRDLSLKLSPGRYEMFCNMEGHYLGGMHREFQVG
jgi:uncharacterized cupredoxin-like copper-binding protein